MTEDKRPGPGDASALHDFEDLFENAPCGYLSADRDGRIIRANQTLARWLGVETASLEGRRFADLLTIGAKLFYETHFAPLLRMQGSIAEVAMDLACADGTKLPTLVNAVERRDGDGNVQFVRITVFNASERRRYEQGLLAAKSQAEKAILEERSWSELREQFIAVLGHDLRNPLASIASGVHLLQRDLPKDRALKILTLMEGSVVRASVLINNVLDFARTRLGAGIGIELARDAAVAPIIEQVVAELRSIAPDRTIVANLAIDEPVTADVSRIGQLTSNLLGNAITHGAPDQPILLDAVTRDGQFILSVANGGEPIEPAAMAQLFQPFFRGSIRPSQQGLGLGLHIAAEIAREHGGAIAVASDVLATRFTFTMPCRPSAAAL